MNVGEVSSVNNAANATSYQGQGSSAKTAPVVSVETPKKDFSTVNNKDYSNQKDNTSQAGVSNNSADKNEENEKTNATSSLREAVSKINAASQNCEAVFGIHEKTNRVMIKMVDKETKETVKEFPAEETLDLIAKAWELAGIMVDERR